MSISSRIEAIEGHIGDIYDTLELGGSDLTNVDKNIVNINSELIDRYKDYLANGTDSLWNNWDNESDEGTELTLNNTIQAKMKIKLEGNTEQATRSGKNLLNNNVATTTRQTVVYTNLGENEFNINGTLTGAVDGYLGKDLEIALEEGKTYTLYFECFGGSLSNLPTALNIALNGTRNGTSVFNMHYMSVLSATTPKTLKTTFVATGTEIITVCNFYSGAGTTFNNYKVRVMLYEGTDNISWEPYGAMPSPEYPSPVNNVTGDVEVKVQNANLYNQDNILLPEGTYEIIDDAISISNGGRDFYKINFKQNTAYTITYDIKQYGQTGNGRLQILYTDGTKEDCGVNNSLTDYETKSKTSNPNKTIDKIRTNYGSGGRFILKNIMINEGSVAPYTPHQEQNYPISLGSLELCKIGEYQDYIYKQNGNWYKYGAVGKYILNGTETFIRDRELANSYRFYTSELIYGISSISISNYFKNDTVANINSMDITALTIANNRQIILRIPKNIASTVKELQSWLSNHNVIVYYPLSTPVITQITDTTLINQLNALEQAYSYNEQTNISQDGDLPFILDVTALTELS